MKLLARLWRRLLAFVTHQEGATALALFRIGLALTVLRSMVVYLQRPDILRFLWFPVDEGGLGATRGMPWLFELLALVPGAAQSTAGGTAYPTGAAVVVVVGLTTVAAALLLLGVGTRAAAAMTAIGWNALARLIPDASAASDALLGNGLWLLVFSSAGATLSVACWRRTGRFVDATALSPSWPRRVAVLQMLVMYTSTGLHKASTTWTPLGDFLALHYILQQVEWQQYGTSFLVDFPLVTQLMTATTWFFELSAPLLLLSLWWQGRDTRAGALLRRFDPRVPFVIVGLGLHIGIWLLMEVGPFSPASLSFYACLVRPAEWQRLGGALRRIAARSTKNRGEAAATPAPAAPIST
jgi:hypothetical protein